jgi:hypothetical protein
VLELEGMPSFDTILTESDERAVRDELRRQISRMEAQLGRLFASAFPRQGIEWRVPAPDSGRVPQILEIDQLEEIRDDLADRLAIARSQIAEIGESEEAQRELLEHMVSDPGSFRGLVISSDAIGEPSCRAWRVAPRFGPLGRLMSWWQVKVSSGCPLAGGHGASRGPH